MASQPDFIELRISKHGNREIILLWLASPHTNINDLDEFTISIEKVFADITGCVSYINEHAQYTKLFSIVSGSMGTSARERIEELTRLLRLLNRPIQLIPYVVDGGHDNNTDESAQYFDNLHELSIHLEEALVATNPSARSLSGSNTSLNSVGWRICDLNGAQKKNAVIYWKRLLVDTLRRLDQPRTDIQQGIDRIKQFYSTDRTSLRQIENFGDRYFQPETESGAICWFTRGDFLSKFLQQALQTKNMDYLFSLRFFIRDLYDHLKRVQRANSNQTDLVVYRSMIPIQDYRHRVNELVTMNSFFSTSVSHDLAVIFAESRSVLYEIHASSEESDGFAFANLGELTDDASDSSPPPLDQQEVLFELYTPFRIDEVHMEEEPSRVVLNLLDQNSFRELSAALTESFEGTACETARVLERGNYWERRNEIDKAVDYYKKLFTILLSNENDRIETIVDKLEDLYTRE